MASVKTTEAPAAPRLPVVNVASVPQRSPFRYPGGKTWLVPYIRCWLGSRRPKVAELIEPFAGGAIVGLTAAFEQLASRVTLVEKDEDVAAVWQTILDPFAARRLIERILTFELTEESVKAVLAAPAELLSTPERAFRTILRNRVQRGGILAPGAGLLKCGENGRGLASRWYPQTLAKRILAVIEVRDRIRFRHGDGFQIVEENAHRADAAFFVDPPYTVAGRRLYKYSEIDHRRLFQLLAGVAGDFLATYDDAPEIRGLAEKHGFAMRLVPMKSTHHAQMYELLIGRDLQWLRAV